ncbi:MAG: hypothetical protein ABUS79_09970 [Pseudomonadota bacterium]
MTVKVRRLNIPRLRLFQISAAAGIALSVMARRVDGFPLSVCAAGLVIALVLGLRSYQWLGHRQIIFAGDHLLIGEGGQAVLPGDLRMWVIGEGEVRLYTADFKFVWRFRATDSQLEVFRAKLTKPFGHPRILVRRGPRRRRAIAAGVTLAAIAAAVIGVATGLNALGLVAILVTAFAFGSFMTASQKVLAPASLVSAAADRKAAGRR